MGRNVFETVMGAIVLIVAGFFIFIAYKSGNINSGVGGYKLTAKFEKIDGLSVGSDVRVSGMKVGTVASQGIENETYYAVVTLNINNNIKLPKDSSAKIASDGLLGGKYLAIVPGGDSDMLKGGDTIQYTQSAVNLEELIAKAIFGSAEKDNKSEDKKAEGGSL